MQHVAKEYGKYGIRANIVGPGVIATRGMGERQLGNAGEEVAQVLAKEIPLQTFGTGKDVANTCVFLASESVFYRGPRYIIYILLSE